MFLHRYEHGECLKSPTDCTLYFTEVIQSFDHREAAHTHNVVLCSCSWYLNLLNMIHLVEMLLFLCLEIKILAVSSSLLLDVENVMGSR